jgi:hypothetical protein
VLSAHFISVLLNFGIENIAVYSIVYDLYFFFRNMEIFNDLVFDKLRICDKKPAGGILEYLPLQRPHDKMHERGQVLHPS